MTKEELLKYWNLEAETLRDVIRNTNNPNYYRKEAEHCLKQLNRCIEGVRNMVDLV